MKVKLVLLVCLAIAAASSPSVADTTIKPDVPAATVKPDAPAATVKPNAPAAKAKPNAPAAKAKPDVPAAKADPKGGPDVAYPYTFACAHCGLKITVKSEKELKKDCEQCACGMKNSDCLPKKK